MDKWTRTLPMVRPLYAVKCNPEPTPVGTLATLGSNFDCASRADLKPFYPSEFRLTGLFMQTLAKQSPILNTLLVLVSI
ncbi:ornithine decarboxylase, putative [Ricinus communis]|uniref:Ornithine decarboxylase, putative n=1 Tax=Ricinus communis TaxID=3988 RepID=B9R8G4_RICCO|nr:ornithine decarboxylase, putative [Ricinus communis]